MAWLDLPVSFLSDEDDEDWLLRACDAAHTISPMNFPKMNLYGT